MKYFFFLLITVAFCFLISCKTKQQPVNTTTISTIDPALMEKKWKTIDSLEQKGLISSALEEVKSIRQMALTGNDSGHLVKAILHEYKYLTQLEEDPGIKSLERLEAEIDSYPEPAKSVMHSLAAQWYGNYLQSHLWVLRNRTEFAGTPGADIRTWGIRHFIDRIQLHFQKSVTWEGLKKAPVENYAILLTEKQNTDHLRPTLYDVLMHRALDFYTGSASYLTAPVYQFVLTDPIAFAPVSQFSKHTFVTDDTISNTWTSLQWYQQLLQFRLIDTQNEAALIDADLKRLRFVYDNIIIDQKDSLYHNALLDLSKKHAGNPESSLIDYQRAELLSQQAGQWQEDKSSSHRYDYNKAIEICRAAIAKYPDAYGSQLCRNLIAQIETSSINAAVESVNLPSEELLTQIDYRNLSSVHLKLIKLPESPKRWRGNNWDGEDVLQRLNQLSALRTWEQKISDGGDHQPHTTEIPLQALPLGHYTLLISDKADFDIKSSTTGAVMFTVSELGYWYLDDRNKNSVAAIINRKTGQPLSGVKAEFYTQQYVSGRQRAEEIKVGEETSDANGWVNVPRIENQSVNIRLLKGNDELFEEEGYHTYRYGNDYDANPTTLFFSDRSIYRPGQKFYFKGYALEFDRYQAPKIIAGKKVEVILYDVNGQEQMKKSFTTNEYGTFAGQFDLPQGGLTGQMSISSSHGANRLYFQVEEYKRPKFEIKYDTLKETVKLNDDVTIRGFAKDYAGSAVPNANVTYRVERVSYRPWWYNSYWKGFWPQDDDRQVLAVGTTTTKNDGSFDIPFVAKPKTGADANLMYRFEITTYVTDITGESHELAKTIVLNKQGFDVNIGLGERVSITQINKIPISALNSDGGEVNVTGMVEITQINGPNQHKRDRLWSVPDILTISESEYISKYPNYFVPGKEKMSEWNVGQVLGSKSYTVQGNDSISLAGTINQPGYYRLTWKWKDTSGKILDIVQYVMVYDSGKQLPGHEMVQVAVDDLAYAPGQTPSVDLLTGLSNPPKTIRIIERRKEDSTRKWFSLPTYDDKTIMIKEDDRGGIYMHNLTAFNNRKSQASTLIRVPWTNKDLQVQLKTWRDKMEPGDEETWTMTVKGSKQEAVTAEMLLSMYDA
ncbi:MAG: MG2 domain-containing protein, partial [Bacteroidota bacterium]|nr:MG2 domain-containing protein [Bacteroidota bacterium]